MFNFELYKEGLRKTKTLGILFIVGMLLGAVAQPLIEISNHLHTVRMGWRYWDIYIIGIRASFMMLFAPFAGAPVITLSIFSFLNKRSDCDFYHAIPHKRETLFGSFIASVLTWVIGGMWLSTTVSVIIYSLSSHATVRIGSVLLTVLGMSVASLLVIAATALAMTITGNRLSNIVVAGIILFLPRVLASMFVVVIVEMTRVVSSANFGLLGNNHYNILFGFFSQWRHDHNEVFTVGTVYTLVLGIIYLVAAGILFKKRQSELAGNPSSKLIQHFIRIAVAFVITLPAILIIINDDPHANQFSSRILGFSQIQGVIVIYIIATFSYFVYEFITMKRITKLTKMIPGLLGVAVLNVIFIVGINVSRNVIMQEVDVASIRTVTIVDLNSSFWWTSYAELNMRGLEIADEEIIDFFGVTLNSNIERFSSRGRQGRNDFQWWNHREVRVRLDIDGGRNITRSVWVRQFGLNKLLIEYEPYQEIFMSLPENPDQLFMSMWANRRTEALTQEQLRHIYDVLQEDVAEVNFEDWHEAVTKETRGPGYEIDVRGHNYRSEFPITEELTPRAFELIEFYLESED